jgi:hypothetical protein
MTITCVTSDEFMPLLRKLGALQVSRATDIEFDNTTGEWFAILRSTGKEIARSLVRAECISAEVKYLNSLLASKGKV